MAHPSSSALLIKLDEALQRQGVSDLREALAPLVEQLHTLRREAGPGAALPVYEAFLGACALEAAQREDGGASLLPIVHGLFQGWLMARQGHGDDAEDTLAIARRWQQHPDVADLAGQLTIGLIDALDEAGLDALQRQALADLTAAPPLIEGTPRPLRIGPGWSAAEILLRIHRRRRDPDAYAALSQRLGITSDDCAHLAEMYTAEGDLRRALVWVEEGLTLADSTLSAASPTRGHLKTRQRQLYLQLGRWAEAAERVWGDYERAPGQALYAALMECLPEADRPQWRRRALERARRAGLDAFIDVALYAEALEPLAVAVVEAGPDVIARLSHFATEPVAVALEHEHPAAAALIYRSLALRILEADRRSYYDAAVEHLHRARLCYLAADQAGVWSALVDYVRRAHGQKHPFMAGFRRVVAGVEPTPEASLLDRAQARWREISDP